MTEKQKEKALKKIKKAFSDVGLPTDVFIETDDGSIRNVATYGPVDIMKFVATVSAGTDIPVFNGGSPAAQFFIKSNGFKTADPNRMQVDFTPVTKQCATWELFSVAEAHFESMADCIRAKAMEISTKLSKELAKSK